MASPFHPGRSGPKRLPGQFLSRRDTLGAPAGVSGITLQGTPSLFESASATDCVVPYPSGIVAGELLILSVTSTSATVPTLPAGWTSVATQTTTSAPHSSLVAYQVATGSESGSVTVACTTLGRLGGVITRWSGVDTTTPLDVAAVSATSGSAVSIDSPTITTVTNGALLYYHPALNASSSADINGPSGPTMVTGSTGTGRRFRIFTETQTTAGATGTRTWTNSTGGATLQWTVIAMALRPVVNVTPDLNRCINDAPGTTTMAVKTNTTNATSVRIKAGTDSALTTGVVFGAAATPDGNGNAEPTITGLTANTPYFYRIALTNASSVETLDTWAVGEFKTDATGAQSFSVGFGSCLNATDSASMAAIATRKPDLFLHLGDEWYADGTGTTVANFRTKMGAKRTATNLKAVYRTSGTSFTPSDHDGMSNNGNAGSDATAWTNWNSVYREMTPTTGLPGATGVYRSFKRGRVRFLRIDRRSFATIASATDNSSKTCLGATQKQWLKDQITNATEPVIVIQNPDPWIGSAIAGDDGWYGYTTERTELADFILASGKNVIFLGGDMHAVAADDGTNAPGKVTVFQGSPLNQNASIKGGPYTQGPYPASGTAVVDQYGWIDFTDTGSAITVAFQGFSSDNTQRVALTVRFTTEPADTLGLTDAASVALGVSTAPADTAGLTDSAAPVADAARTATDSAGLTDTPATVQDLDRAPADSLGATDSASPAQAQDRAPADTAGLTDATATDRSVTVADSLGITDSVSTGALLTGNPADSVGLTDMPAIVQSLDRAPADGSGLTDAASQLQGTVRAPADSAGITDSLAAVQAMGIAPADSLGLADSAVGAQDGARSPADTAGLTDSAAPVQGLDRQPADSLGLTDSASYVLVGDQTAAPADNLGLTDAVTDQMTADRALTDAAGLTDSAAPVQATARTSADNLGVTDSATIVQGQVMNPADSAGLTDSGLAAQGLDRIPADSLGLSDSAAGDQALNRAPADTLGLTDSAADTVDSSRAPADPLGATDAPAAIQALVRDPADPAGLTDAVSLVQTQSTAAADNLGLTDSGAATFSGTANATDTGGITDTVTVIQTQTATPADSLGITDSTAPATDFVRTTDDPLGVSDFVTAGYGYGRFPADTAGLTDSPAQVLDAVRTAADPVGVTDPASDTVDISRSPADPAGLTDSGTPIQFQAPAPADLLGVTDTPSALQNQALQLQDSSGATDSAATVQDSSRTSSDTAGLTDSPATALDGSRIASDILDLTDSAAAVAAAFLAPSDTIGITDSVSFQITRGPADTAGLADQAASDHGLLRADTAGITDSTFFDRGTALDDLAGLTDQVAIVLSRGLLAFPADSLGILDQHNWYGIESEMALTGTIMPRTWTGSIGVRTWSGTIEARTWTGSIEQKT